MGTPPASRPDLSRLRISRRFGRIAVNCDAALAFAARNAHPRIRAQLVQIGKGGCAVTTKEKLFINEDCLVWAAAGGHKFLGIAGRIVWSQSIYHNGEVTIVGIEFKEPVELPTELLARLGAKPEDIAAYDPNWRDRDAKEEEE